MVLVTALGYSHLQEIQTTMAVASQDMRSLFSNNRFVTLTRNTMLGRRVPLCDPESDLFAWLQRLALIFAFSMTPLMSGPRRLSGSRLQSL